MLGDPSPSALKRIAILFRNGPNQRKIVPETMTGSVQPGTASELDAWLSEAGGPVELDSNSPQTSELDSYTHQAFPSQSFSDSPRAMSPPNTQSPVELDADPRTMPAETLEDPRDEHIPQASLAPRRPGRLQADDWARRQLW